MNVLTFVGKLKKEKKNIYICIYIYSIYIVQFSSVQYSLVVSDSL